jgi:hypothetical protein
VLPPVSGEIHEIRADRAPGGSIAGVIHADDLGPARIPSSWEIHEDVV